MRKTARLITLALAASTPLLNAQMTTTSFPLGNAITEARYKSQITADGAPPYHILININEPGQP